MEQMKPILETRQLSKKYDETIALEAVNLQFLPNNIYGLFGRNGAGKTTLLNILTARIFADNGEVFCHGKDIVQMPAILAENCCYMPEQHYFPGRFRLDRLLAYARQSFPNFDNKMADRLSRVFKLDSRKSYSQLSRGHQSIFRIVIGLASNAPITIFDEPVLGLDAVARDEFYSELIETFSRNPRLFIISTHLIEESADLFNEAIIFKDGKVIRQDSVENLLANVFYVSGTTAGVDEFLQHRQVISSQVVNTIKTAVVVGSIELEKPWAGLHFSPLSMQKLFIHLTSEQKEQTL